MELVSLPMISLRSSRSALFPGVSAKYEIGRKMSVAAVKAALQDYKGRAVFATQQDREESDPSKAVVWTAAVEGVILKTEPLPSVNGAERIKVIVSGESRVNIRKSLLSKDNSYLMGECEHMVEPKGGDISEHLSALAMSLQGMAINLENTSSFKPMRQPKNSKQLSLFVDRIAYYSPIDMKSSIELLDEADPEKRIEMLHVALKKAAEEEGERLIEKEASGSQSLAGSGGKTPLPTDPKEREIERLRRAIAAADMTDEAGRVAEAELHRMKLMPPHMADFAVSINYLDTLVSLPWKKETEDRIDIDEARNVLNEDHYGLDKPKDRILEFLAVRKLCASKKGSILCFSGPPGVGKTSLGKSIARAMNRRFIRMSVGGISDEAEVRGHRRTYIGALPGRVIQLIKQTGVKNPVFMIDEMDKMGRGHGGDPSAAMLEVLDPEQNFAFMDNYLAVGFDLSSVMFIITANDITKLHPALRDRLDIVQVVGYSPFDKIKIAKHYLVPKQKSENGLVNEEVTISDRAIGKIVEEYTSEAGVRSLERECGNVMRKLAVKVAAGKNIPSTVSEGMVGELLGAPRIFSEKKADAPAVGLSTGLAWTPSGGTILFIESVSKDGGKGRIKLTGNLGKVMEESASIVKSWIRSNCKALSISAEEMDKLDIHVHVPSGATPKDGPSAGVAIAASIVSLLSGEPVRNDVAATGEISLRGRVMPIGGVREKILAAHRAGIAEVVIPRDNEHDLKDIPEEALRNITIHKVDDVKAALDIMLLSAHATQACETQTCLVDDRSSPS